MFLAKKLASLSNQISGRLRVLEIDSHKLRFFKIIFYLFKLSELISLHVHVDVQNHLQAYFVLANVTIN